FGEEMTAGIRSNPQFGYVSSNVRQKFDAYERDSETGLDFAQARYFGSVQGRFTSVDPYSPITDSESEEEFQKYLLEPHNWNRYVYVWNNPLKYIDPTGEKVYIIAYTTGNDVGDEVFKKVAETMKNNLENSKGFDKNKDIVLIAGVKTKEDFKNLLDRTAAGSGIERDYGQVANVSLVSHGAPISGPYFQWGTTNSEQPKEFLKSLSINWDRSGGSCATFSGCNTANFAQEFADVQRVPAHGFDSGTSISGTYPNKSKSYLLTDIFVDGPHYMVKRDGGGGMVLRYPRTEGAPSRRRLLERR
ncbi:MAG: RHS repeat-associated core domain-containing protein, partial [Nitrososphaerales archaeon]